MNTITKIIAGVVSAGAIAGVAIPTIYTNQVDKFINTQKNLLATKNISLIKKEDKDSFFHIHRTYLLQIDDITTILKTIYPEITPYELKDLKEVFDKTTFELNLDLDKFPTYHKKGAKVYLSSFNDYTQNELQKDKVGKQILEYIQQKAFELDIDIDKVDIKKVYLKDMDLTIDDTNIKLNGFNILVDKTITTTLKTFQVTNKQNYRNSLYSIENVKYEITKQNDFNYKTKFYISDIKLESASRSKQSIKIKDFSTSSKTNTIVNSINLKTDSKIKNISVKIDNDYINIDNFVFNTQFTKLDLTSIKKIVEILQNNSNREELKNPIQTLISNGFGFKISPISIEKIDIKVQNNSFNISPISLQLNSTLTKNNFQFDTDPSTLINSLSADLMIKTTKDNIDLLTKLNPMVAIYLNNIMKIDNNEVTISLTYKNGSLTSNGQKLF